MAGCLDIPNDRQDIGAIGCALDCSTSSGSVAMLMAMRGASSAGLVLATHEGAVYAVGSAYGWRKIEKL
jgi:hypothetical protein